MSQVSFLKTRKKGKIDYVSAVVEIVNSPPEKRNPDGPVEFTMWAEKHGFKVFSWKKRFFRLNGTEISYYASEKAKKPKGVITLTPFCVCSKADVGTPRAPDAVGFIKLVNSIPVQEQITKPYGIKLTVPEVERTYYFHPYSEEDRASFITAINNNLEVLRKEEAVISDMIEKVARTNPEKVALGMIKMSLRSRHRPRPDPSSTDPFIRAFFCASHGKLGDLQQIFDDHPHLHIDQGTDFSNFTALMKAAQVGQIGAVRWLLSRKALPNLRNVDGDTALILASRTNQVGVVRLLLEYGADRSLRNKYGESAMDEAAGDLVSMTLESYFPPVRVPDEKMMDGHGSTPAVAPAPIANLSELALPPEDHHHHVVVAEHEEHDDQKEGLKSVDDDEREDVDSDEDEVPPPPPPEVVSDEDDD